MEDDFSDIVGRIRRSDEMAFRKLFDHFQKPLFHFLVFKTGDRMRSEDILQETFLRVWTHRHELKEHMSVKSYLYTMAHRLALNDIRYHQLRLAPAQPEESADTETPETVLERSEFRRRFELAVASLPEQSRVVFCLSRIDGFSYKEIAGRMSISVKTVESHMGKALKMLRGHMREGVKKPKERS